MSSIINLNPTGNVATPSGSDTQIQFNDSGAFGGDSGLTYNKTTDTLTIPNIGTSTASSIIVSTLFRSANSGNVAFIAQPSGTGAFQLQQTDNTVTGGNARGANAVDLQANRTAATQVASGVNSFTAGRENTASGSCAIAIGLANTATATGSFAAGRQNSASGTYSIALGENASTKSINSAFALGSNAFAVSGGGGNQVILLALGVITSDATPAILRSDALSARATNQLILLNNSSIAFTAIVTATTTAAGNCSSWKFEGQIQRGANAASTALVAAITPVLIAQKAGAVTWAVAVTADTTNGCLAVTVTGQAATTIRWTCTIFASEVAF